MEVVPQTLQEYMTPSGEIPFRAWLHGLRDINARAKIRVRLNRLRLGNFGDAKSVGSGVSELRIPFGPGYRIYYARAQNTVVLLLCGGDKGSQKGDVEQAKAYWQDYQRRSV